MKTILAIMVGLLMAASIATAGDKHIKLEHSELRIHGGAQVQEKAMISSHHEGTSETCTMLKVGLDDIKFCADDLAGGSSYSCQAEPSSDGVDGSCECEGACTSLPQLCDQLGGEMSDPGPGAICSF